MAVVEADSLTIHIDEILRGLSPEQLDRRIFRVPDQLRNVNRKSYEPELIAIGPYHHNKVNVKAMEEHKLRYLRQLLRRRNENTVKRYIEKLRSLEERALNCYEEPLSFDKDEFVLMMLVDGCFIIELIRKHLDINLRDNDDPILKMEMFLFRLKYDLLLLENQLPFFILWQLFEMTELPNEGSDFISMCFKFFKVLPGTGFKQRDEYFPEKIQHLLGLMHDNWLPSYTGLDAYSKMEKRDTLSIIRCATKLKEAGIKFKKAEGCSLFDIKFENGIMKIPALNIQDDTESILRNLIAYEQFSEDDNPDHVTDYMILMDCLINTAEDVELLCHCGIIEHHLGDDKMIAKLFNKLGENVTINQEKKCYYAEIIDKVNVHCSQRRNVWMAKLRHDYFNSPWSLISLLAASVLLILTSLQTVYTVMSYYK